jgi:putative GTP pyrophosphokinase
MITYQHTNIPPITKGDVRRAGETLKRYHKIEDFVRLEEFDAFENAFELVSSWRSLHSFPLNTLQSLFRSTIKRLGLKEKEDVWIGQRHKRMPTIINKISRIQGTLETMQDIGGIRIVTKTLKQTRLLEAELHASRSKQRIHHARNYIDKPKPDGYRGIHLIYRYHSPNAPEIMQGMSVELQLRTLLQHYWATAVESVDMFYGESLKTGGGEQEWKDFFLAVSAAFAFKENCPRPAHYANATREEVRDSLRVIDDRTHLINKLEALPVISEKHQHAKYCVLTFFKLADQEASMSIVPFQSQNAAELYYAVMGGVKQIGLSFKRISSSDVDMVLVETDPKSLKKLYSNYFLDVRDFVKHVKSFMAEK